jgi:CRISPR-associated protein Csx14
MTVSLLAPLGGQPQVITFALDCLLRMGETIDEVYLLHLAPQEPRLNHALRRLHGEFPEDRYAGRPCRLRRVPLTAGGLPLADIRSAADAEVAWRTARDLIAELKQQGQRLHLCVAGGRRVMGLMVQAAATLLCDHGDRLWHLYTPTELRKQAAEGAILHAPPDSGVALIPVPMAPWGAWFPALRAMAQAPQEAVASQMNWQRSDDERRCRAVIARLTRRQEETLRAFAGGLRPQEVAAALGVTLATTNAHKTAILAECRIAWEVAPAERLNFHFIAQHFGQFF